MKTKRRAVKSFPQRLRRWQSARGLMDSEAAARLGVPLRTYENWVQGHRAPRGLALQFVLRALERAENRAA